MPLRRYFSCVGGVLLAVLFILDACFPKPPVVEKRHANLPPIRIHSDRKWPERVVYDTSLPTIVPTSIVSAEATVQAPETTADATRVKDTFAMLQLPADRLQRPTTKAREVNPRHQIRIARRRAPAPRFAMVRQPQFGWFGG